MVWYIASSIYWKTSFHSDLDKVEKNRYSY